MTTPNPLVKRVAACANCRFGKHYAAPGPEPERPDYTAKRGFWASLFPPHPVIMLTDPRRIRWLMWVTAKAAHEKQILCRRFPQFKDHLKSDVCGEFSASPAAILAENTAISTITTAREE